MAEKALKALHGSGATWYGPEQRRAVANMFRLTDESCELYNMPTGYGKSLLFLAPALFEPTTVQLVVVPYRALASDLCRRALAASIPAAVWKSNQRWVHDHRNPASSFRIVFMVANALRTDTFDCWISALANPNHKTFGRIFVDECHVALTEKGYRPEMYKVFATLHRIKTPIVFLSATVPPAFTRLLYSRFGFNNSSRPETLIILTAFDFVAFQVCATKLRRGEKLFKFVANEVINPY
jgi:superfamily II DNA helicase RecQ